MNTDQVFKEKINKAKDFEFNTEVVHVFDDMVVRSVPYYSEIQRMIGEIAGRHARPNTSLYDLGCSTGATFLSLSKHVDKTVKLVGIDESQEMLDKCNENLLEHNVVNALSLRTDDLNKPVNIKNASVVVLCLTLQFVRPMNRAKLIESIYSQLNKGGCLIIVEKVLGEGQDFNREFIEHYYSMKKRNNYSELEIAQKREALENILIPYKLSENIQMLFEAGFKECETFFKWYNFAGLVALK